MVKDIPILDRLTSIFSRLIFIDLENSLNQNLKPDKKDSV